ncbi:MAG: flagellar hook-length control protein FliK [Lachnospiraceae bacterium]
MVRVDLNQLSQIGNGTKSSVKRTDSKTDSTDFSELLHDRVSEDRETASQKTEELQDKKPADDKDETPVENTDQNPSEEETVRETLPELLFQFQNSIHYTGMMGQTQMPELIQEAGEAQIVQDAGIQVLNEMGNGEQIQTVSGQMLGEPVQGMELVMPAAEGEVKAEIAAAEVKVSEEPSGEETLQETGKVLSETALSEEGLLEKPAKAESSDQSFDSQDTLEGQSQPAGESMYQTVSKPEGMDTLFRQIDVKSAMNSETVSTSPETFAPDIGKALAARIPEKNGTLTIELEPASLGKLTIRVVYESDRATVSILASNPKTLELLNQNAAEIAHIMEEKTGQQTMIYVPESQEQMDARTDEQGHRGQDRDQEEPKHRDQSDAFAQRLRLGLV